MPRLIDAADFAGTLGQAAMLVRDGAGPLDIGSAGGRLVSYVFSDPSVGRDQHSIAADAWQLDRFLRNPVFLWAHDADAPPIGRVVDIATRGNRLVGTVQFAEAETYPFADTIFRLTKGGFLNATSTGWIPLAWTRSADRARPGGLDFSKVELLEISAVPVPALPTALVSARAQGIDTRPLVDWAERLLDTKAEIGLSRATLELLRQEARMPAASLPAEPPAAPAEPPAAPAEPPVPAAEAAPPAEAQTPAEPTAIATVGTVRPGKRSLADVGWLAMLLESLGCLQQSVAREALIEGDGSAVPSQMHGALQALGQVLIAMTQEEVAEALAGTDAEDLTSGPDVVEMAGGIDLKRNALRALRRLDDGALAAVTQAMRLHLGGRVVLFQERGIAPAVPFRRAGRVLSAENERCLRAAQDHVRQAATIIGGVVGQVENPDPGEDDPAAGSNAMPDDAALALRARKAKALDLKHRRLAGDADA